MYKCQYRDVLLTWVYMGVLWSNFGTFMGHKFAYFLRSLAFFLGYSVQMSIQGCPADMGIWVWFEQFWYIHGSQICIFSKNFLAIFMYWSTINTYIHLSILCYSLNSSQIELNYFTECLPYTAHPSRVRHVTTQTPSSFPLLASHERVVFQTFSA